MSTMVFCRGCAKEIHNTAVTCPGCGAPQRITGGGGKSKVAAALLAFFLGGLGIHRFYLGKWWGVLYLLFCWTFIPGFIALIEGIVFLCTSDEKWDAKHNGGVPSSGGSGAGIIIAIVLCVFVGIAFIGILAAVAIPAYSDYTSRAKMAVVYSDSQPLMDAYASYYQKNQTSPPNIDVLGVDFSNKNIRSVDIDKDHGAIVMTLKGMPQAEGKHFVLTPHLDAAKNITWACDSEDLKASYLPTACRAK
jgi:TM2 domain-containing membrane protein YozV/Tfp pilus assembly protein PilE